MVTREHYGGNTIKGKIGYATGIELHSFKKTANSLAVRHRIAIATALFNTHIVTHVNVLMRMSQFFPFVIK